MSLSLFKLSADNPNDSTGGGGCVCHPGSKAVDCQGPYVIFNNAESLEPDSPHVVASAACLRAAVGQVRSTPANELSTTGEAIDTAAKIAEVPEPNVTWAELTAGEQDNLASFPPDTLVKMDEQLYVRTPGSESRTISAADPALQDTAESVQSDRGEDDPLLELAGEARQEEPGSRPGEYVPAEDPEEAAL